MSKYLQEMFWTPAETIEWIRNAAGELGFWIVLWSVDSDAQIAVAEELESNMLSNQIEDSLHFFFGTAELSQPQWRKVGGRCLIDYPNSYAIQFVPSLIGPDGKTLLEGRLTMMPPAQYPDSERGKLLFGFFRSLQASMGQASDSSRVIVQPLAAGQRKIWQSILVGNAVPADGALRLKQFFKGDVVFGVESLD